MNNLVRNLLTEWRKLGLPFAGETFVVAVSGGADSVSLAIALAELKRRKKLDHRFVLAHFNHDLRGEESEMDAEFVADLARQFDFEFALGKGKISKKGNLEQNARFARYEFLLETAANLQACGILTAHTVNDQAETFLLNLIRGSGLSGLTGMKPFIPDYKLKVTDSEKSLAAKRQSPVALIRPLLNWARREETEAFCVENEIAFRRDAMNDDLNFRRVGVRKKILPVLREFNPKIIETLAATAKILRIEISEQKEARKITTGADFLVLKELVNLSQSALYNVLREWLRAHRGNLRRIELKHVEALAHLIVSRKSGRVVELPNGETVIKQNGKLFWRGKNIENIEESA